MRRKNRAWVRAAIGGLAISAISIADAPSHALATYRYEGRPWTFLDDDPGVAGSPALDGRVTLRFTVAEPLPANRFFGSALDSILSFTLFDGRHVITEADVDLGSSAPAVVFDLSTDASGAIEWWWVQASVGRLREDGDRAAQIETRFLGNVADDASTVFQCLLVRPPGSCVIGIDVGSTPGEPGSWTRSIHPIPEPSSALLLGLGLAALGGPRLRRIAAGSGSRAP